MRPAAVIVLAGGLPALTQLGGTTPLQLILQACAGCRRLQPLSKSVYVVLSQQVHEQVQKQAHAWGLQDSNLLHNGCSNVSSWQGDVHDLRLAVARLGPDVPHCLVLSASSLCCAPGFNLQRLLEHGLTRAMDAVGVLQLGPLDTTLLQGSTSHTLAHTAADPQLVPPLAAMQPGCEAAEDGAWVVQPVLFLRPGTLTSDAIQGSTMQDLVSLACEMHAQQHTIHTLALGPGYLQLSTPASLEHARKCVAHMNAYIASLTQYYEPGDIKQPAVLTRQDAAAAEAELLNFNAAYLLEASVKGATMANTPMPYTFYMTATRRQQADLLR